jgi:hypothetical protein
MASPAQVRDYKEWIAKGKFEDVGRWGTQTIASAIESRNFAKLALGLQTLATCYYSRGAVALLDGRTEGWHDIQSGYMATIYCFQLGVDASECNIVGAVMTLALAQLFGVKFDEQLLRGFLAPRYDVAKLTGKVTSGRFILDSIYLESHSISADQLRRDRRECCQKIEAWPARPVSLTPFGVLDVEMAINFPEEAEFPYPQLAYLPTEDAAMIEGITAYHAWMDK